MKLNLISASFFIFFCATNTYAQSKIDSTRCQIPKYDGIVNAIYLRNFDQLCSYFALAGGNLVKSSKEISKIRNPSELLYPYTYENKYSFCDSIFSYKVYVKQPCAENYNLEVNIYTSNADMYNELLKSVTKYKYKNPDLPQFYIDYVPPQYLGIPFTGLSVSFFPATNDDEYKTYNITFWYHKE